MPGSGCEGDEPAVLPDADEVQQIVDSLRRTALAENHLADLRASGLNDERFVPRDYVLHPQRRHVYSVSMIRRRW